jgi:transglutaminase/protease-like cytokinesis protein 3
VRAIFRWITENIAYDFKYYNKYNYKGKEPKSFNCSGDSMQCEIRKRVWETEYVNKVLDQKKAVCQGYSMLFKKMCDIAGIPSEVVPGYVRTEYYEVGTIGNLSHAWNAVC